MERYCRNMFIGRIFVGIYANLYSIHKTEVTLLKLPSAFWAI